ncbi:MAG TPA: hypothetical protein VHX37_11215 [Acidobacteriaceae bacterium]|nr:hypothetical protein [Acidobacteriaceae bacterium]
MNFELLIGVQHTLFALPSRGGCGDLGLRGWVSGTMICFQQVSDAIPLVTAAKTRQQGSCFALGNAAVALAFAALASVSRLGD